MKTKSTMLVIMLFLSYHSQVNSQDMFRLGLGFSFVNSTDFVHSFSFDFNRTENIKEKIGKGLYYGDNNIYLIPSADVNLGQGTSSAENNVNLQISLGKSIFGKLSNSGLKQRQFNRAFEVAPSYTSDKNFMERLYYGQISYKFNFIASRFSGNDPQRDYVISGDLIAVSPFTNIGTRRSDNFDKTAFYITSGFKFEAQFRRLIQIQGKNTEKREVENLVFKISALLYVILSDINAIYNENLAGKIVVSVDKRIYNKLAGNLSYKFGNNGPTYKKYHLADFGIKIYF
ncbi:MAG: hypothetical protein P8078_01745 [bacterium]